MRAWIGRRRQFGLDNQLLVKFRNEDRRSFKNFMRMPTEMFDELLTRVDTRTTHHQTTHAVQGPPGAWPEARTNLQLVSQFYGNFNKGACAHFLFFVPRSIARQVAEKIAQCIRASIPNLGNLQR